MIISKKIKDSIELRFSKIARKMNSEKKIFYSLGLGEPNFNTPRYIIDSSYKAMKSGYTKYSSPAGLYELRKLVAKKLIRENTINAKPEDIIITPGSKMALSLALISLIKPYDEIIYFSPSYTSYVPQMLLSESRIVIKKIPLSSKNYQIDFSKLEKKISNKTKAILINFPNNPTGQMIDNNIIKKFEKILNKYKKCYLISDEIYEKLNFSGKKHISPASLKSISKRVITINGFSKAYAMTGWRIGYCHANKSIIKDMIKIQQHINTNVPTFTQMAAVTAYKKKSNHIKLFNSKLLNNFKYLEKKISKNKSVSLTKSYGGLFVFINIKKTGMNSDKFCSKILKKYSVAITPGMYFGEEWKSYIRISLAQNTNVFRKAINLLNIFLNQNYKIS
tara:strand:- start:5435 stop:6610 length:1176 start_codon:yes stop_codon:yes gene_type:complete